MSHAIAAAFDATHRALDASEGSLTSDDLIRLFPPTDVPPRVPPLDQLEYYVDFATEPRTLNAQYERERQEAKRAHGQEHVAAILAGSTHHKWRKQRQYDYRLTATEHQRLQQHGIMVSERLGSASFAGIYHRLYSDDLPVFVTSDSILHAWHRSFDAFLSDLEVEEIMALLGATLSKALAASATQYDAAVANGNDAAASALAEVELFLATAHRLLVKDELPVVTEESYYLRHQQELELAFETSLGLATPLHVASNANRLAAIVGAVHREKLAAARVLGSPRDVDFSLFKPRGHYVKSEKLMRYFRAMTWLGTMDFRISTDRFQLQCACMVVHVLREANVMNHIQTILDTIAALAGDGVGANSMSPMQLDDVIGDRDILLAYFGDASETSLASLLDDVTNGGLGTQAISGHPLMEGMRPPTAFTVIGQQFVWSAFIFSKLVFDQVSHDGKKVPRRMPSGVDAAFALFGNDAAASEIATRMAATPGGDTEFVKFRDGLPYTSNLIAARRVVDEALAKADPESGSVALLWQIALRELSLSSPNEATVFKSAAWQKRLMNTQLASFTQLRHDTVLYAKQAATRRTKCEYPAGYVDPYPSFWRKMHELAKRTLAIVETLGIVNGRVEDPYRYTVQSKARMCFGRFVSVTQTLEEIALAQAQKQVLTEAHTAFLKHVIESTSGSGATRYAGWYPSLFYTQREDSGRSDQLVADVHTDVPSAEHGDPGGILHLGVGNVNLAMLVVDKTIYAGPVFSHYELVTPINTRLTDAEFSERLPTLEAPQWARESFLVPKGSETVE